MMSERNYDLPRFIADLRRITGEESDESRIVRRVAPLARRLAATPGLVTETDEGHDEAQGFRLRLLHEEPDHGNAVFLFSWLPGCGTPAHDHKTWGVVVGVEGEEQETWWRRVDDGTRAGHAQLEPLSERRLTPGDVSSFLSDDIHAVRNDTGRVSWSLHVYGRHINHTGRSEFDPVAGTEKAYVLNVA